MLDVADMRRNTKQHLNKIYNDVLNLFGFGTSYSDDKGKMQMKMNNDHLLHFLHLSCRNIFIVGWKGDVYRYRSLCTYLKCSSYQRRRRGRSQKLHTIRFVLEEFSLKSQTHKNSKMIRTFSENISSISSPCVKRVRRVESGSIYLFHELLNIYTFYATCNKFVYKYMY